MNSIVLLVLISPLKITGFTEVSINFLKPKILPLKPRKKRNQMKNLNNENRTSKSLTKNVPRKADFLFLKLKRDSLRHMY